ncbi:hypothetical protein Tco_1081928, partial [Tanacetum coccineum]
VIWAGLIPQRKQGWKGLFGVGQLQQHPVFNLDWGLRLRKESILQEGHCTSKDLKNMSSIAKFDIAKFNGSNNFVLIQHGWEAALDPLRGTMTDVDKTTALKTDVYKKAHSALLLCLDNKVLREVNKEDSTAGV